MPATEIQGSTGLMRSPGRDGFALNEWLYLAAYCFYLVVTPFHLLPAGMPQIADFLMLLLGLLLLIRGGIRLDPSVNRPIVWTALFVVYTAVVNLVWAGLTSDPHLIVLAAYYPFNLIALIVALILYERYGDSFIRATAYWVMISVFIQIVNAFVFQGQSRELSFFKDNQLAYWALLSASIFFLSGARVRVHTALQLLFSLSVLYLVLLSISRAALLSLPVLYVVSAWRKPLQILITASILIGVIFVGSDSTIWIDARDNLTRSDSDDVSGRGYTRIFEYPQYTLFGAGEGAVDRFGRDVGSLHSTLGTIFFSYGVVGLGLFFMMLWSIFRAAGPEAFAFILPAFLFGLTHQGLKFPLVWLLVAIILCIGGRNNSVNRLPTQGLGTA